jgi:DNA-binding response OmpR family regulator
MSGFGDGLYALVVDDDPFIAELLQTLLEENGFVVDVAFDGIDVLEPRRPYDVILLDLRMPVFDGERLVTYWSMTQPEILKRIIVLSGYSRTASPIIPTLRVVAKPFHTESLLESVRECVQQATTAERSGS